MRTMRFGTVHVPISKRLEQVVVGHERSLERISTGTAVSVGMP